MRKLIKQANSSNDIFSQIEKRFAIIRFTLVTIAFIKIVITTHWVNVTEQIIVSLDEYFKYLTNIC